MLYDVLLFTGIFCHNKDYLAKVLSHNILSWDKVYMSI